MRTFEVLSVRWGHMNKVIFLLIVAFSAVTYADDSDSVKDLVAAVEKSNQRKTMAGMLTISMALEAYEADKKVYPVEAKGRASSLISKLEPTYMKKLPLYDAWGNALLYYCANPKGPYWLISLGKDARQQPDIYDRSGIPNAAADGATKDFEDDLILSNGEFLRADPELKTHFQKYKSTQSDPMQGSVTQEKSLLDQANEAFGYSQFAVAAKLYGDFLKEHPEEEKNVQPQIIKCYYNLGVFQMRGSNCLAAHDYFVKVLFLNEKDQAAKEARDVADKCQKLGADNIEVRKAVAFMVLRK
jgi:type II secretion system (T2SS) protein G